MSTTLSIPLALVAELTHRCPLHCVSIAPTLWSLPNANQSFPRKPGCACFKKRRRQVSCKSISPVANRWARTDIVELVPRRPRRRPLRQPHHQRPSRSTKRGLCRSGGTWASIISVELSRSGRKQTRARNFQHHVASAESCGVLEWLKKHPHRRDAELRNSPPEHRGTRRKCWSLSRNTSPGSVLSSAIRATRNFCGCDVVLEISGARVCSVAP